MSYDLGGVFILRVEGSSIFLNFICINIFNKKASRVPAFFIFCGLYIELHL